MKEPAFAEMQQQEQTYWWHISRRLILQTILSRFFGHFSCRHSGESLGRLQNRINQSTRSWTHPSPKGYGGLTQDQDDGSSAPPLIKGRLGGVCPDGIKILDVGCGTGANFAWLSKFGEVTGVEINKTAVELARPGGKIVWGRAEDLPVEDKSFDLVVAFDVLEHLSDETRALEEWRRVLNSRGKLFIAVPAYPRLFGPHDIALEHYRRYSMRGLNKLLKQNGFKPVFYSHIFCLTFPLFFVQRFLVRNSKEIKSQYISIPKWLNNFLIGIGKIESIWLKWFKFPYGSSIAILAIKE